MDYDLNHLASLEEETRRDLEAIARVRKMMALRNGPIQPPQTLAEKPTERPAHFPASPIATDNPESIASLRGTIAAEINKQPLVRWTVQKMVSHLASIGYEFKAQKPVFSVGQAMKKLSESDRIKIVRQGSGSAPHIYGGATPKQESVKEQ